MKLKAAIIAVALAALSMGALWASTLTIRSINASASEISIRTSSVILNGSAHVISQDKVTKNSFDAVAEKMIVNFYSGSGKGKVSGLAAVKSAVMDGPVKIVYTEVDASGNTVKTTATADSATYDGSDQMAHLVGNVRIVNENPAEFEEPAVMTGDMATVNLKPNLGPDDLRFKVESTPGLSSIQITPKPQPKKGTK